MAMLTDLLKEILANKPKGYQSFGNKDRRAELPQTPTTEGTSAGKTMSPATMQAGQAVAKDPKNIYNDQGQIVDYDMGSLSASDPITKFLKGQMMKIGQRDRPDPAPTPDVNGSNNPFSNILSGKGNGEGTFSGWLNRMMSPVPSEQQTGTMDNQRGTLVPPTSVGGKGDPNISSAPLADVKVPELQPGTPTPVPLADQPPAPPPADYSMPNAMDPQQIEQLRNSILGQTFQFDPNYPDGLSGRMNSPYSELDKKQQMQDAERQDRQMSSNAIPGYSNRE